ncbi:hypothetical protein NLJ89_g5861 [Agrocybe chaxingu]|uniref:F-box domain-containing protein n=1 Tax=Agrocybe chaxingu TaxID=84603 RepID=A0A9W8MUM5_9AGAR|nr:hypothetical protein NLJ89_g5861 [Agrocybe chaxingu]
MAAMSLLALPAELQLEIMGILDAGSLLCLALCCRALHELFKSPAIQYTYELLLTVMQDNGTDIPLDVLQSSLQRLRKGWESLDWTFGEIVKLPGGSSRYELISGIFVMMDRNSADFSVCRLSSATQTGWTRTITSLDFCAIDFTIDPSHDLLVLLEKQELPDGRGRIQAHARRISTDGAHPNANVDSFHFEFIRHTAYSHRIQLADDVVAVWSHHGGRLLLWNWREGFLIHDSVCSNLPKDIYSLEMLSRKAFILKANSGPGKIYVCKFSPTVPAPPTIVATLLLPPTASSDLLSFVTHSSLIPGYTSSRWSTELRLANTTPILSLCTVAHSCAIYIQLAIKLKLKRYLGTVGAHTTHVSQSGEYSRLDAAPHTGFAYYASRLAA